jgi:F-type H+-transporting ATPase subunit alpha
MHDSPTPEPSTCAFEQWRKGLVSAPSPEPVLTESGRVTEVGAGVAVVSGLARALADELVVFASGVQGQVFDLEPGRLGVILLGPAESVRVGEAVHRTRKVVSVPVGPALLGRVVDALGRPRDGRGPIHSLISVPVEAEAASILERAPVTRPLATGITAVDAAIPVGLGQRQLIIGDRQTGKTSLAVDAMLNQRRSQVICIYCAVGQRGDAVAHVIHALRQGGLLPRSIVVHSGDEEAPGLSYTAPYAAMAMAEHLAAQQRDVLLVIDDMTHHARAYRELSLLMRRPPGREAFPGDIFYVHARLLERAGQFGGERGTGSITVLPVVETEAENLSAYIPTNLISITDGQIYLSPRLVRRNQFPAVDLGLSVSRVGGKAQGRALRSVAGNLRVTLSQFEELEDFARFGTRLDHSVRDRLARGAAVRAALRQAERDPMSTLEQLAVLTAAMDGLFDDIDEARMAQATTAVRAVAQQVLAESESRIAGGGGLSDEDRQHLIAAARAAVAGLTEKRGR